MRRLTRLLHLRHILKDIYNKTCMSREGTVKCLIKQQKEKDPMEREMRFANTYKIKCPQKWSLSALGW